MQPARSKPATARAARRARHRVGVGRRRQQADCAPDLGGGLAADALRFAHDSTASSRAAACERVRAAVTCSIVTLNE